MKLSKIPNIRTNTYTEDEEKNGRPYRDLLIAGLVAISIMLLLYFATTTDATQQLYELEVRGNGTIWVWSDQYSGARVMEDCEKGEGCLLKIACENCTPASNQPCNNTITLDEQFQLFLYKINNYTHDSWSLTRSWQEGSLIPTIGGLLTNSTEKSYNRLMEWFEMELMPDKDECEKIEDERDKLQQDIEVYEERISIRDESYNATIYQMRNDNEYYQGEIGFLQNVIIGLCGLIILALAYREGAVNNFFHRIKGWRASQQK